MNYLRTIRAISPALAKQYKQTVMSIGAAAVRDGFDTQHGGIFESGQPSLGPQRKVRPCCTLCCTTHLVGDKDMSTSATTHRIFPTSMPAGRTFPAAVLSCTFGHTVHKGYDTARGIFIFESGQPSLGPQVHGRCRLLCHYPLHFKMDREHAIFSRY